MRRPLAICLSLAALQGCSFTDDGGADVAAVVPVQFSTIERQENLSTAIGTAEERVVLNFLDYSNSRFTQNGGFAGFFTDDLTPRSGLAVSAISENFEVASAFTRNGDNVTVFNGLSGTSTLTPTTGTAIYDGDWALAFVGRFGFVGEVGDLTLEAHFGDGVVTGTGTQGANTEVLTLTGQTAADGTISGTWVFQDDVTGDLEAAVFGEGASEIAGTISNDTHAGVIVATRAAE